MDKPEDTRNWRCLFGMHQYKVIAHGKWRYSFQSVDDFAGSYFTCQCQYCGKIKRFES